MKKIVIELSVFALITSSCGQVTKKQAETTNEANFEKTLANNTDTLTVSLDEQQLDDNQPLEIYIKDKSQYDQTFIEGLSYWNEPIKLIDNYIVFGKDTAYFPDDLQINKKTSFRAEKENSIFVLTVTKVNLTNLTYQFQLINQGNKIIDSSGIAILGSMFFLGVETDEDSETGDGYVSTEYWDEKNDCSFAIRIGDLDDNGKQRAKIIYGCKDKSKPKLEIDDCPTLRAE